MYVWCIAKKRCHNGQPGTNNVTTGAGSASGLFYSTVNMLTTHMCVFYIS